MKKGICMLISTLLLLSAAGAFAEAKEEYTYLAILNRFNPPSSVYDFVDGAVDTSHTVHAVLCFSRPAPLLLPAGSGTEKDYSSVGARVTFDKPFDVFLDQNGLEIVQLPDSIILEPKRVEIIGDVKYGVIVEIGEDYVIHDAFDESGGLPGDNIRYTVTPDTLIWYEEPFQAGSGCQMIVDSEGMVLAMDESNG